MVQPLTPLHPIPNVDETTLAVIIDGYRPKWFHRPDWAGTTYSQSLGFCRKQSMVICPLEAYCPRGRDGTTYDGILMDEPFGSWAPIRDSANEWVSVSSTNTCTLWSNRNDVPPPQQEVITRHILCCQPSEDDASTVVSAATQSATIITESEPSSPEGMTMSQEERLIMTKFSPRWYDRADGWFGSTYQAALEFCAASSRNTSMTICPIEAYCPSGVAHSPFGGVRDSAEIIKVTLWAAALDNNNQWIGVSSDVECMPYQSTNSGPPMEENFNSIGYVMCCVER